MLCGDADRTRIYHEDVDAISAWMRETRSDPVFAAEFYEYLNDCSSRCFGGELEEQCGDLENMARQFQLIGFNNVMCGRLQNTIVTRQSAIFRSIGAKRTGETWVKQLSSRLLQLSHNQWIFSYA